MGFNLLVIFLPGSVALGESKAGHRPAGEGVSWCLETSLLTLPSSLFIFYILSSLLLKTVGCLSGCLMFSASVQKLFCGIRSAFNVPSMNLWGRKRSPRPVPPPS